MEKGFLTFGFYSINSKQTVCYSEDKSQQKILEPEDGFSRKSLKSFWKDGLFTGDLELRLRTPFLLAFLLLFLALSIVPSIPSARAATSPIMSGNSIQNIVTFNTFGQFSVNDTMFHSTNSTSSLSSFSLGFPINYSGHITQISLYGKSANSAVQVSESTSIVNNTLSMAISVSPPLPAGVNSSVSLGFYVLNTFVPVADGNFSVPIVFSPAVNIPVDSLSSHIILPYLTTHIVDPTPMQAAGFSHTVGTNATLETWDYTGTNVSSNVRSGSVLVYSNIQDSGALDFTRLTRKLSVSSNGQVIVTDTLNLRNLGENTIYSLSYSPLTNDSTLTALPNTEPPIANLASISISGSVLDLNSTEQAIQPLSSVSLVYQYPLGQQYWNYSGGTYHVSIPTTAPIPGAIVDEYQIQSSNVPGVIVSGNQISLTGYNTTAIGGSAKLSYSVGIASAFGEALPVAAILFIGVFVGAIVFRPKQGAREDSGSTFDALTKTVEDKVSGTNEILSELKSKGSSILRNDLIVARSRIDDFRIKTNSKVGTLRAQLINATTAVQAGFNEVLAIDREFDRVVKDMLNNYDQLISRRMKEETFARLQQSNERRLQNITNSLLDRIHDLREEYESES